LPTKVNPKVPEPVQRVLLKALAKNRLDRYTSTEELMTAFKQAWTEAGVPMEGTAIVMRSTNLKDKTDSKNESAPADRPTAVEKNRTTQRSPWMWVGVGIVILLCFVIAVFAVRKNRAASPSTPTIAATLIPVTQVLPSIPQPIEPSGNSTPVQNTSPELTVAMELAAKNPKDPDAHLALALALLDAKEVELAREELVQAANLAGPNNKDFFLKAAEKFKVRGAWVPSAGMYLRLAQTYRKDNMPKEILNDFHEAVYKATEQKDMPLFVSFERIENADPPLSYIARGRHALFYGRPEDAKIQLANAEKEKPDMYEAALLKAEIEMKTGNQAEAKNILLSLSSDPKAPEWIRFMAENYLKTIQ
jgi:hypothetical protein